MGGAEYPREACTLVEKLLRERDRFFDRMDVLNSDGRRLLEKLIRIMLNTNPSVRRLARKVRRNPTRENIVRLAEELHCPGEEPGRRVVDY